MSEPCTCDCAACLDAHGPEGCGFWADCFGTRDEAHAAGVRHAEAPNWRGRTDG